MGRSMSQNDKKLVLAISKAMQTQFLRRGAVPPWETLARIALRVTREQEDQP